MTRLALFLAKRGYILAGPLQSQQGLTTLPVHAARFGQQAARLGETADPFHQHHRLADQPVQRSETVGQAGLIAVVVQIADLTANDFPRVCQQAHRFVTVERAIAFTQRGKVGKGGGERLGQAGPGLYE